MKTFLHLIAAGAVFAAAGCVRVKVDPIHVTVDVKVKVDKELDSFFGDLDAKAATSNPTAPKGLPRVKVRVVSKPTASVRKRYKWGKSRKSSGRIVIGLLLSNFTSFRVDYGNYYRIPGEEVEFMMNLRTFLKLRH